MPANHKHGQLGAYKPNPRTGKAPTTARDHTATIANATNKDIVQMGESWKGGLRYVAEAIKESKRNNVDTFVFRFCRDRKKRI